MTRLGIGQEIRLGFYRIVAYGRDTYPYHNVVGIGRIRTTCLTLSY